MGQEETGRSVPEGFELVEVSTKTQGVEYTVEVLQVPAGAGIEPILSRLEADGEEDPEEALREIWNGVQRSGATNIEKADVTEAIKAVEAGEGSKEAVEAAIESHQKRAREYFRGASHRGRRHASGLTAEQRKKLGDAVAMEYATGKAPTQARMAEIAEELGLDPALVPGA